MSADEMREHVKALHEKITSEQQSLESLRSQPGLKVLLGDALRKHSLPLPWSDLMRGKGSMSVNKMQWRQEMRRLVEQPLTKEVDDLFAELADKAKVREHQMELQNREDWVHMVEESVKKGEATVS